MNEGKTKKHIELSGRTVLVTGSPGFIGAALVMRLLGEMDSGHIISFDNMNDYYDPALKELRLREITEAAERSRVKHTFIRGSIADKNLVDSTFSEYRPSIVVNLAAQAGVRYSIDHPDVYIESNIIGFYNILEACRNSSCGNGSGVEHLVYASSSSVYGNNSDIPFSVEDKTDKPVSLYAATKKSDELLAYAYSKLYSIPMTGLRFFTVYGPAGRPDMFYYSAADRLSRGENIRLFNYGNCKRDFTFIDDIIEGLVRVIRNAPESSDDLTPMHEVYNIGGGKPVDLKEFIYILSEELIRAGVLPEDFDLESHTELTGMQPGDVALTYADTGALERDFGFVPEVGVRDGLRKFAEWYGDRSS